MSASELLEQAQENMKEYPLIAQAEIATALEILKKGWGFYEKVDLSKEIEEKPIPF